MPERLRIVFLIGQLGLGGSERQLSLLMEHFDRERFDLTIVVFNPSPYLVLDAELRSNGVRVIQMPAGNRGVLGRSRFLYRLFRELRPHLVQSWTLHDNPYAGLVGRLAGVPQCWGALRGSLRLRGFRSLAPMLRWLALHSTSKIVVTAVALQEELSGSGVPAAKVLLLPNCTRLTEPDALPDLHALGLGAGGMLVGSVGNLRRVKNHMLFIEAMARVRARMPEVQALIAGQPIPAEADLPALLEEKIRALGLEGGVVLAGFQENVPGLMRRMDVFCLTSDSEGAPNVLLEAMAARLPVVATRVGGVPEIVQDGETGILVPPGDTQALAVALLARLSDPGRRAQFGKRGRRQVETFHCCKRAADRLGQAYVAALAGEPVPERHAN